VSEPRRVDAAGGILGWSAGRCGVGFHQQVLILFVSVALFAALGCGDGAPVDDDDDTIYEPSPSPCGPGFLQDPELPAELLDDFPDGCVPQKCGIGRWGNLEVEGDTVFVDAYAGDGGDGSEQAPFTSIQAGVDAAGEAGGGLVAVAAGTYVETLDFLVKHTGVQLAGRCHELVELDASEGEEDESGISADAGYSSDTVWDVSGLTVSGAPYIGIGIESGLLTAASIAVVGNWGAGVLAHGSTAEIVLSDVKILDTRRIQVGMFSRGISVQAGARLEATSCLVSGYAEAGIVASHSAEVILHAVEILDAQPVGEETGGRGIVAEVGSHLEATSCLVSGAAEVGIYVSSDAEVILRDVEVSATQPLPAGTGGEGVLVQAGARLEAYSCRVVGNSGVGIVASDVGSGAFLHDVEVLATKPAGEGAAGRGINAQAGAQVEAFSCRVVGNSEIGIFASDAGTDVVLSDVEVLDTWPEEDGTGGRGINVQDDARLEAFSCLVSGNAELGIFASDAGTSLFLHDVEILDTKPAEDGTFGRGINVMDGARVEASSCLISGNADVGIFAENAAEAVLCDVEVLETQPIHDGTFGRGIEVLDGARLEATSCLVSANCDVGLFAGGDGTEVVIHDVEVWDTLPAQDLTSGDGLAVQDGARLEASSCSVSGNANAGISAMIASGVVLQDVEVSGNAMYGIYAGSYSEVVMEGVEVRDTQSVQDGTLGRGINVQGGARLDASSCLVSGNVDVGIYAGSSADVVLQDVEVRDTRRAHPATVATGVVSQRGAELLASYLFVSGTEGPGLMTASGALSCTGCDLFDNTFAGALAWAGGALELAGTTLSGTRSDANEGGGIGIYMTDRFGHTYLKLDGVTIEDQPYAALWLDGAGSYSIEGSTLYGGFGHEVTYPDGTSGLFHGDVIVATGGVFAWDGAQGLLLQNNEIREAVRAGLLLDGSTAELAVNTFTGNATDVIWQDCDGVDEPVGLDHVPVVDYCPVYNHHITPLEFNLYLEEVEPLDREGAARSTAAPAPFPLTPTEPSTHLFEPFPRVPAATTKALPTAPNHRQAPISSYKLMPAHPSRAKTPPG